MISGRVSDEQIERALSLRSTFENQTWAELLRWVFDDPGVAELIAKRVTHP